MTDDELRARVTALGTHGVGPLVAALAEARMGEDGEGEGEPVSPYLPPVPPTLEGLERAFVEFTGKDASDFRLNPT